MWGSYVLPRAMELLKETAPEPVYHIANEILLSGLWLLTLPVMPFYVYDKGIKEVTDHPIAMVTLAVVLFLLIRALTQNWSKKVVVPLPEKLKET